MHPTTQRAYELLDRLNDKEFEWAMEAAQRDPNEEDALLRWQRQMPEREPEPPTQELIYKTFAPPQPQSIAMDEAASAAWNKWCDRRIRKHVEAMTKLLVAENKKLRDEIGSLRAEVEVLRGIVKSNNVTPMRGRDVA